MSLPSYGLLRGDIINVLPFQKIGDHYNVEVQAAGKLYRVAIDVYSVLSGSPKSYSEDNSTVWDTDRLIMFYKNEQYAHPVLATMLQPAQGFTPAGQLPAALHLDYLRSQPPLFPLGQMKVIPPKQTDNDGNDLNDDIDPWIQKALNNPQAEIFAFGSGWDDSTSSHPDPHQYFNPNPSLGVHDVHMNQGDAGSEAKNNGAGQDGALFIRFIGGVNGSAGTTGPSRAAGTAGTPRAAGTTRAAGTAGTTGADTWIAMFFRFQNQSTAL